jgi:hypothetical protein
MRHSKHPFPRRIKRASLDGIVLLLKGNEQWDK